MFVEWRLTDVCFADRKLEESKSHSIHDTDFECIGVDGGRTVMWTSSGK